MVQIIGFFVLAFPKAADQNKNEKKKKTTTTTTKNGCRYCMPNAKISKYISIESKSFSEQPINSNSEIFKNVAKIATGQRDDSTRPCLFDHLQFIEQNKAANP